MAVVFFARHFLKLKKADREVLSQAPGSEVIRVMGMDQETNPGSGEKEAFDP